MNTTKAKIFEVAYRLFQEQGYDNVTVNDICSVCNITKTTFYYHLKSKEEIISNFYEPLAQRMTLKLKEILAAKKYWQQIVECYTSFIDESENLGYDLTSKLFMMNLKEDQGSYDFRDELSEVIIMLINKAKECGQIRNPSPTEELYRTLGYTYIGLELMWCVKKSGLDRKELFRQALISVLDIDTQNECESS